jgi:hypothetical protein
VVVVPADASGGAMRAADAPVAVARLLATSGSAALEDALALTRAALDADDVVLRAADASRVIARANRPGLLPSQPRDGRRVVDAPLRTRDRVLGVLTASAPRPFTAGQAGTLLAVADVLALALDAPSRGDQAEAARVLLDEEAERAAIAAAVDERVGEALVAARWSIGRIRMGELTLDAAEDSLRAAHEATRGVVRGLRAHALEAGLRFALGKLVNGDLAPAVRVSLDAADPALDALPPAVAVCLQRVAEAVLLGARSAVRLVVRIDGATVKLTADAAENAYDASELQRWTRRVSALGGDLRLRPGGVELSLPAQLAAAPAIAREGPHDNRPDL